MAQEWPQLKTTPNPNLKPLDGKRTKSGSRRGCCTPLTLWWRPPQYMHAGKKRKKSIEPHAQLFFTTAPNKFRGAASHAACQAGMPRRCPWRHVLSLNARHRGGATSCACMLEQSYTHARRPTAGRSVQQRVAVLVVNQ